SRHRKDFRSGKLQPQLGLRELNARTSRGVPVNATSISASTIVKKALGWSIALSILMILAGCLAIAIPVAAGIAINLLVAWLLMFSGGAPSGICLAHRTSGGLMWELLLCA